MAYGLPGAAAPLLLEDSVLRVHQQVPALPPGVAAALAADVYTAPSRGGVDRETDHAYCATPAACHVWRATSAAPTCYTFPVPSDDAAPPRAPHVVLLPRPLNASEEPALLQCSRSGALLYWNAVSDAFTASDSAAGAVRAQLPLLSGEAVTCAARLDARQALVGTTAARVLRVQVQVHGGAYTLDAAPLAEPRGLLGRWLGAPGASHDALVSVSVQSGGDERQALVAAVSARHMQLWRVPLATGAAPASGAPRVWLDDPAVHKHVASQVLQHQRERYSAAAAHQIVLCDAALSSDTLLVLYADERAAVVRYGLARFSLDEHALHLETLVPLRYAGAPSPHAATPRVHLADGAGRVAFVALSEALLVQPLDGDGEALRLRDGADRVLGACVPRDTTQVRCVALTARSGVLAIDVDVARAAAWADSMQPSAPGALDAQARRLEEHLERAVWFDDVANPLQLDALPDDLPAPLLETSARRLSAALVSSTLRCLPRAVDLRTQLAQRTQCALRLVDVLGRHGDWMRLDVDARAHLLYDAELLAGATDLWRVYDAEPRPHELSAAVAAVLGDGRDRAFFETELAALDRVLAALHTQLRQGQAVHVTRCVLALLGGARRLRAEHGDMYAVPHPAPMAEPPWYATDTARALLHALYDAALARVDGDAGAPAAAAEARAQLGALAELVLDAYAARLASPALEASARASLTHEFERARATVLPPLLRIHRGDHAKQLAERYEDFAILVRLVMDDAASGAPGRRDALDVVLEHYVGVYGAPWADALFSYYASRGQWRALLTPPPAYAALLRAFLASHPPYARLAWLEDVAQGAWLDASDTLAAGAARERASLATQQRLLSVGKLARVAALGDVSDADRALEALDDALDLVHVQRRMHARWDEATMLKDAPPEAQAEHVAATVATRLAATPALRTLFVTLARQVAAGHVAPSADVMDLLTMPDASFSAAPEAPLTDFAIGAQVLVRMDDAELRDAALTALWRRCYLLDDWHALSDTASYTDAELLERIGATAAARTLTSVAADPSTAALVVAPDALAQRAAPTLAALTRRFPDLPAALLQDVHAELAAEHAALQAVVRDTMLVAFMQRWLAAAGDAPAAPVTHDMEDDDAAWHGADTSAMPGGAWVAETDSAMLTDAEAMA